MELLKRIYDPKCLLPESKRLGDVPGARDAYSTVMRMAWPAIIESMLVMLTSVIDTMMVGTCGTLAIAAIGVTNPIRSLIISIYNSLNIALLAIIARRIGEDDKDRANDTLRQGIILCIAISFIILLPGFIFGRQLILLSGALESHFPDALNYFCIWLAGLPAWSAAAVINAANRGAGNPRVIMVSTMAAQIVNIVLNYILINGKLGLPALGVSGAALATSISFFVQFAISLLSVIGRHSVIQLKFSKKLKFDTAILKSIGNIGSSSLLEAICVCGASIIFTRIVNSLGSDDALASWQIMLTLYNIVVGVANGFSAAVSSLVGQNLGRKRPDLAVLDVRICMLLAGATAVVFFFAFVFFGRPIAELYVPDKVNGAATIENVTRMLRILGISAILNISNVVFLGTLRGAGDTRYVSICVVFTMTVIRTASAYFLCNIPAIGVVGTWCAVVIDESVRIVLLYIRFKRGKWKALKV